MKYLNDKTVTPAQPVVHMTASGTPIVGLVQTINEARGYLRITGYALPVTPDTCIPAEDAYAAVAGPILAAKAEAAVPPAP